jgi:hypothetical protein
LHKSHQLNGVCIAINDGKIKHDSGCCYIAHRIQDEDQTPFSLDSEFFKAVHDVVEDDRRDATVFLEGKDPDCKMGWLEFDGVDAVSRAGEKRIPGIVGPHVAAEGDGRSRVESRFHSLLHPFV